MILGLIPARSGSRGIPNKNIKLLAGKPLIAHAIDCGLACPSLDHVVVTTDSEKIANIAMKYGAEVPFLRPKELAEDSTHMLPVMQHALKTCEVHYNETISVLVLLDPTSPLRIPDDIESALKVFREDPECDCIMSACLAQRHPSFNMVRLEKEYVRLVIEPEEEIGTRQSCPPLYDLDSTVFIFSREALIEEKKRMPAKTKLFMIPEERTMHIDSEWDFKLTELKLKEEEICYEK